MTKRKQDILNTVDDLVSNFMYYNRKEDETLPRGSIEEAVAKGEITVQEIIDHFSTVLTMSFPTRKGD